MTPDDYALRVTWFNSEQSASQEVSQSPPTIIPSEFPEVDKLSTLSLFDLIDTDFFRRVHASLRKWMNWKKIDFSTASSGSRSNLRGKTIIELLAMNDHVEVDFPRLDDFPEAADLS